MSGRVSVGCKSPLTGGIKEANSGGQGAQVMGRLGYAAIILEGKTGRRQPLQGCHQQRRRQTRIRRQPQGLGNYATVEKLSAQYGEKVACISIGQAGEMKMSAASIAFTTWNSVPPAMPDAVAWAPSWDPKASRPSSWMTTA
jgi:aldehyde:ferredoxin oxidoreductase